MGKHLLFADPSGELKAFVGEPRPGLRQLAGRYRIAVETPDLLILHREDSPDLDHTEGVVLMAGQIVSPSTVLEVVNTIVASRWIGTLHVYGSDSQRRLGFYKGMLRHAESDMPEDRFDKVLFRIGVLTPAQVESVMRDIKPDQRFGELLVERGLVERQRLFEYLGRQMEEVLRSAVLVDAGSYAFYVAEDPARPPAATAHIPVQSLLLDAAEWVDRFALFRKLIPDGEMCPEVLPGVEVTSLGPRERLILGYSDGKRTLDQIASETWLGRFATYEAVYELLQQEGIRLNPPRRSSAEAAERMVAPFNLLLAEIYTALEERGEVQRVRRELQVWVAENDNGRPLAGAVGEDGLVTPEPLARVLAERGGRHQVEELQNALHELTSFALFSASLWLPREQERALSRRISQRLKGIGG